MKITIKCLKGGNFVTEVNKDTQISELKSMAHMAFSIPENQQTLVLFGKTLRDDKTVGDYPKIQDGTKIYVAVKKPVTLNVALMKTLRKYYSEDQCKVIIEEFMRNFHQTVENLSLDDLERIAKMDSVSVGSDDN